MRKVSTFFSDFNQKDMVIPIKIVSFVIELNYSNTMYGKMKDFLSQTLAEIKEAGLYKEERLIESAQQAAITVKGKEVLNFCANNYLGLSNHPRLIKASQEMMNRRGYGMSSVRFICGTQPPPLRRWFCRLSPHRTRPPHIFPCRGIRQRSAQDPLPSSARFPQPRSSSQDRKSVV